MKKSILILFIATSMIGYSQSLEYVINKQFYNLKDSCLLFVFPQKQFAKLKYNYDEKLGTYNVFDKTFKTIPYFDYIKNSGNIYITYVEDNFLVGHFVFLKFAEYLSGSFFVLSKKYNLFLLFYFTISFIDTNEKGETITNQERKGRFTFIDGSPIELYVYDSNFNLLMELMFFTHHGFEGYSKKEFCFDKSLYYKKGENNCNEIQRFLGKTKPLQEFEVLEFFQWIQKEYSDKNAGTCKKIKDEFPANLFRSFN